MKNLRRHFYSRKDWHNHGGSVSTNVPSDIQIGIRCTPCGLQIERLDRLSKHTRCCAKLKAEFEQQRARADKDLGKSLRERSGSAVRGLRETDNKTLTSE